MSQFIEGCFGMTDRLSIPGGCPIRLSRSGPDTLQFVLPRSAGAEKVIVSVYADSGNAAVRFVSRKGPSFVGAADGDVIDENTTTVRSGQTATLELTPTVPQVTYVQGPGTVSRVHDSKVITGSGTNFQSYLIGQRIKIGSAGFGDRDVEDIITGVTSTTSLTIFNAIPTDLPTAVGLSYWLSPALLGPIWIVQLSVAFESPAASLRVDQVTIA